MTSASDAESGKRTRRNAIDRHRDCAASGCGADLTNSSMRIVVDTSAEIEGDVYHDWDVHFCSPECMEAYLDQSFPLNEDAYSEPTVFEPDVGQDDENTSQPDYHEDVIATIEQHDNIEIKDGEVVFPYIDDDTDPELKFAAYMDNPMDDDDPYILGERPYEGIRQHYGDDRRLELPKNYVFDNYGTARRKARDHAAALDLYEGGTVLLFVPGTMYSAVVHRT